MLLLSLEDCLSFSTFPSTVTLRNLETCSRGLGEAGGSAEATVVSVLNVQSTNMVCNLRAELIVSDC